MAKCSIIIPAYNEENYIEKCLEMFDDSVETIVVANGCTDKTAEVAKKYATKVVEIKEKGVSKARNEGARLSESDFLIFLDADIILTKDNLEKILSSGNEVGTCYAIPDVDKFLPKMLMKLKKPFQRIGWSSGLIFCKKEIYEKVNGFDESLAFGEDGKFLRTAKKHGKFGVVDAYVVNSMRRFEKSGYLKWILFWIKNSFKKNKSYYEVVR